MRPVLYQYWRSSASWRVRWALGIKGVDFDSVPVDITAGEQRGAEHRARNPIGHVPTLVIDGRTLSESVAIMEYLDETVPAPALYPREAFARARVRQLVEVVNSGIQPLQNLVVLAKVSAEPAAQKAWVVHFNERGLEAYERLLEQTDHEFGSGRFSFGDEITAADLCLVPQVATARRFGVDLARFPRVSAVERAALATAHAARALPENQPGAPAPAASSR